MTQLQAGEVINAFVDKQDQHYLVNLEIQINAPQKAVYALITNYAHLDMLSDSIVSSEILQQITASRTQVKLVSKGCVLFMCQTVTQVQNVQELDNGYIHIDVDPSQSNVKLNTQLWQIEALDNNMTRIHYSADVVPDFWIPPLIGSWVFQNMLLEEVKTIIKNAEKWATLPLAPRYTTDKESSRFNDGPTTQILILKKEN